MFAFFFFQAEDGIRDTSVTGVQTCALPILWLDSRKFSGQTIQAVSAALKRYVYLLGDETAKSWLIDGRNFDGTGYYWSSRSEERRVGKECRYRKWTSDGTRTR